MENKKQTCCICGKEFEGWGHNPEPVKTGRCCDYCNFNVVLPTRISRLGIVIMKKPKVGDKIHIVNMDGEPDYKGREGVIEHIDDIGQLHGTWGGCGILPSVDEYYIIG